MTVGELIVWLDKFPREAEVLVADTDEEGGVLNYLKIDGQRAPITEPGAEVIFFASP